jgi:hypothetical protein
MELSPSGKANSCSSTQEFPNVLSNTKVHCRSQKTPLLAHILSQINPVPNTISYFYKMQFNIILLSCLDLSSGLYPSGFATKTLHTFLFAPCVLYAQPIFSFVIWSFGE